MRPGHTCTGPEPAQQDSTTKPVGDSTVSHQNSSLMTAADNSLKGPLYMRLVGRPGGLVEWEWEWEDERLVGVGAETSQAGTSSVTGEGPLARVSLLVLWL